MVFCLAILCLLSAFAAPPKEAELTFLDRIAAAAFERTHSKVTYNPAYFKIPYPNGDVPASQGVCTDVVIRTYRALGIDLQKDVHEDMAANFSAYPKAFALKRTDRNIDHRRVPNLRRFFERHGRSLPVTKESGDYLAGDLVTWDLGSGQQHIGVVADKKVGILLGRRKIVHNIGVGEVIEDVLFDWPITGHYRYFGS